MITGLCECEHAAHDGACLNTDDRLLVRTPCGVFFVCRDCADGHLAAFSEDIVEVVDSDALTPAERVARWSPVGSVRRAVAEAIMDYGDSDLWTSYLPEKPKRAYLWSRYDLCGGLGALVDSSNMAWWAHRPDLSPRQQLPIFLRRQAD